MGNKKLSDMKSFNILVVFFLALLSCKQNKEGVSTLPDRSTVVTYTAVGDAIKAEGAVTEREMYRQYQDMEVSDTLRTKFTASVTDVCKAKGCWMKVKLEDGQEAMVKFKDYGFFMPKDVVGKEVVMNGKAYVEEMSVEEQKHYAADGGAGEDELSKITMPKKTFGFEADGVLITN